MVGDEVSRSGDADLNMLPFTVEHALTVQDLAYHHRDPFDRALLGQAKHEGHHLVTDDRTLLKYKNEVNIMPFKLQESV